MPSTCVAQSSGVATSPSVASAGRNPASLRIAIVTGCRDKHYAYGLATALASVGVEVDLIGSDEIADSRFGLTPNLTFINLGWRRRNTSLVANTLQLLIYYARLLRYAATTRCSILHILWNNRLEYFDRTLLMLCYKLLAKKIVFTAHNVNAGVRDTNDSLLNRLTLRLQYRLVNHIFVHTDQMKQQLQEQFGIREDHVTAIPYGINNSVPCTDLSPADARRRLGIADGEKTILFFGNIGPYKGLEHLITAYHAITSTATPYRLLIVGKPRRGAQSYLRDILTSIRADTLQGRIIQRFEHIPDSDIELYFKASDAFVLPYTHIFQSGVLFLGYNFGLPVIASDVGSLRDDIVDAVTGYLCKPGDPVDLANTLETYFRSELYLNLASNRRKITQYAANRHSWVRVAEMTRCVYAELANDM